MRKPQPQTLHEDEKTLVVSGEETTLVAPLFNDEETLVARPVVPLVADAHEPRPAPPESVQSSPYAPRRSGMLALALVSVLVGGVLGGAGLYLYQRQSQAPAATPQEQQPEPADAQTPAVPADAQSRNPTPPEQPARQTEAPAVAAPSPAETAPPARAAEVSPAPAAREPENVPAAGRRTTHDESDEPTTPKRTRKGARDEERERRATPPTDANVARTEQPEARRVDSIFYRPRRANRRARRDDGVDRLRRIFEGSPQ